MDFPAAVQPGLTATLKCVGICMSMIGQRETALVFCATQHDALAIRNLSHEVKCRTVWCPAATFTDL